jgi:hypothetical protein
MLINAELEGYSDDDYAYLDNNRLIAGQTINKPPRFIRILLWHFMP